MASPELVEELRQVAARLSLNQDCRCQVGEVLVLDAPHQVLERLAQIEAQTDLLRHEAELRSDGIVELRAHKVEPRSDSMAGAESPGQEIQALGQLFPEAAHPSSGGPAGPHPWEKSGQEAP